MELISVVVPVYNVEKFLNKCVESILKQSYSALEIILVDDGSTDSSGRICDEIAISDNRIKVIHKGNEGLGLTRNAGINVAQGKYIAFIDSDDYIASDYIQRLYNNLKNTSADVCYCGHTKDVDGEYHERKNPFSGKIFHGMDIKNEVIPRMCGCRIGNDCMEMSSCMALYQMNIIQNYKVFFPSERTFISEDLIFNIHYLSHCSAISISECTGYFYATVNSSLTRKYNPDRLYKQIVMTDEICRITKELGIYEKCEDRIYNNFMTWVRAIIKTEQSRSHDIGFKQSINQIKMICNNTYVRNISKQFDNVGVKKSSKLVNTLIRLRMYRTLWVVMYMKNRMGV